MNVRYLRVFLILLVLSCLVACGGGTTGTGDVGTSVTRIRGVIVTIDGVTLGGVEITVAESGVSTVTAADGTFSLTTELEPGSVQLLLTGVSIDGDVIVTGIPDRESTVTIEISVGAEGTITVASVDVSYEEPEAVPTPTPTETRVPPRTPVPSSTAEPAPVPVMNRYSVIGSIKFIDGGPLQAAPVKISPPGRTVTTSGEGSFDTRFKHERLRSITFEITAPRQPRPIEVTIRNIPDRRQLQIRVNIVLRQLLGSPPLPGGGWPLGAEIEMVTFE